MNMVTRKEISAAATVSDPRWAAVLARNPKADGEFVYSVKSTGVYCRPSCGARTARPENVAFHATPADARRARAARGIERVSPASRVQGCHRPDAEGLCQCASREAGAQGAWQQRNGDAGDLRRRLQLAGPVLRGIESIARHDAHSLSCRRRGHRDPLRGARMLARVDPRP